MFDESGHKSQPIYSTEEFREEFNGPYRTERADTEFVRSCRDELHFSGAIFSDNAT